MEDKISDKQKIQRIKSIVEKEIEKELISKQNEVLDISEKIKIALRNLELLKYVIAVSYFDQNPVLSSKKNQEVDNEQEENPQTQIHPCIKKLLPFRENYNKSFGDAVKRQAYETCNKKETGCSESASVEIKNEPLDDAAPKQSCSSSSSWKPPQCVPPLPNTNEAVMTVNSARGYESKDDFRIVVGNVSKWLPPDTREDSSTYKWMVYIRNKDESKDVMKLLKKVRYFLHESYKPHDIIDVGAPFQLTRRGWGEFPIRVQLHFVHPLDKPVDIIHNLKLDMSCSGVQMLGGETVVEIRLHLSPNTIPLRETKKPEACSSISDSGKGIVEEKQDVFDGSLLTSQINGMRSNERFDMKEEFVPKEMEIKREPEDKIETKDFSDSKTEEMKMAITNSRRFLLDRRKAMKIIEIEHDYFAEGDDCRLEKSLNDFARSVLKFNPEKIVKNSGNVLDSSRNANRWFQKKNRLNETEFFACRSEGEIFQKLKEVVGKSSDAENQPRNFHKVFRHSYLASVLQRARATNFKTVESLIRWLIRRWPVITKLSLDPIYKMIHPYSCPTEEEFFRYSVGKQRSAEWFRAKSVQKVLNSLKSIIPIEEEIWSTKQILLWSRFHGYFPWNNQPKTESPEENDGKIKSAKSHETSSDSDEGHENFPKLFKTDGSKYLNGSSVGAKRKSFKKKSRKKKFDEEENRLVNYDNCNTCTEANEDSLRFGTKEFRIVESAEDFDVDVVELERERINVSPTKKREAEIRVETTEVNEFQFNKFVCHSAREIGVKIVDEEIVPGVKCDSVSRVISRSVSSFLEDLVRRSHARGWTRNGDGRPNSLELNDVLATLIETPQFDIFTNRGLGQGSPEKSEHA